jgi:hypothetical protein
MSQYAIRTSLTVRHTVGLEEQDIIIDGPHQSHQHSNAVSAIMTGQERTN